MKRLTTAAELIDYFWRLVDKNGPLPGKSTGVKSRCDSGVMATAAIAPQTMEELRLAGPHLRSPGDT
jgi:hypothetical protein